MFIKNEFYIKDLDLINGHEWEFKNEIINNNYKKYLKNHTRIYKNFFK